jgi:lipopolysaccharide/colanic/teichoic acid biosynthesis glycosyltransferase
MKPSESGVNFQQKLKRAFDLFVALSGMVLIWPIFLIIGIAIKLNSPGPIFYKHRRIGKDGKLFSLYKFRSMEYGSDDSNYLLYLSELIESEKDGSGKGKPYRKLTEDRRVTKVGRFLRNYYLDELPQILNILDGSMSLVGPRPHVQLEVDRYTPEQRRRLSAVPGMTGLWQVSGKAECTFSELITLDLKYIDHWSFGLDIQILLRTFLLMMRGGEGFWARVASRLPITEEFLSDRRATINPQTRPRNSSTYESGNEMMTSSSADDIIIP